MLNPKPATLGSIGGLVGEFEVNRSLHKSYAEKGMTQILTQTPNTKP